MDLVFVGRNTRWLHFMEVLSHCYFPLRMLEPPGSTGATANVSLQDVGVLPGSPGATAV